jgi:pentafunctional AROM polypeptide
MLILGQSLLVASYHDCGGEANWSSESSDNGVDMFKKYRELYYHGDIIKLIGKAHSIGDNFNVTKFVDEVRTDKPIIAMLMGPLGKLSRCLNTFLVPVTHPLIPIPAAPGQLSISQINIIRESIGLIEKREYFLAGDPISTSMSPILHNQGFKELGLPHQYELLETNDWKQVLDNIMKPSVYGASITIPLKVSVLQNCVVSEKLSVSARAIGAVNTLIKLEDGSIVGDNTDWIGIKNCILKRGIKKDAVGVVLGAGGTARAAIYALKQLEVSSIRIWNRTIEKAKALGEEFGCETVKDLNLLLQGQNQFVIVGCIPSTAQQSLNFSEMFMNVNNGIIVEMAYIPRQTPLLIAALGFEKVEGIEVLLEQGYAQFEIWTGHQASRIAIKERVMGAY